MYIDCNAVNPYSIRSKTQETYNFEFDGNNTSQKSWDKTNNSL